MIVVHTQEVAFFSVKGFLLKWFPRAKVSREFKTFVRVVQSYHLQMWDCLKETIKEIFLKKSRE